MSALCTIVSWCLWKATFTDYLFICSRGVNLDLKIPSYLCPLTCILLKGLQSIIPFTSQPLGLRRNANFPKRYRTAQGIISSHQQQRHTPDCNMAIKVVPLATGEIIDIEASDVGMVKSQILAIKGIPMDHQDIICEGKALEDGVQLEDGSTVHLSMGLYGGCGCGCKICGCGGNCKCQII
ncbi:hypothetical protein PROFUN_00473 [Planoprotostelium fungivorum]|uniref:Ubiquitin-like domain-containing protein n=1 Tax=Planoprotostelium fungivorum TaxID=1890364 RepID=A0A2P6N0X6_9EUKA|nr:hypothetical protein PROFUN_00473 [Planoprotostelium fungivorum]